MLTPTQALDRAATDRQRRAIARVTDFAHSLGERVGWMCRPAAGGTEFEAVALHSARTCATIDAHGELRLVADARPPAPMGRRGTELSGARRAATRRAAEHALRAHARPRPSRPVR